MSSYQMSAGSAEHVSAFPTAQTAPRAYLWWVAALAIGAVAYAPMLQVFFRQQWLKPHYQYFPFVIAAFVWLLADRWRKARNRPTPVAGRPWLDFAILGASFALLIVSIFPINSPWGVAASLILLAAYLCRRLSRRRAIPYLWGIWALLWLIVPLPFNLDQRLSNYLQTKSSQVSSIVLDMVGVPHVLEGNTLELQTKKLFVDEACSGIVSILSVVACAAIYGVVKNRPPLHVIILAIAGIGWATVINVLRITSIAILYHYWSIDWTSGTPHELLSLGLFLITFLALLSTDQLLVVALAPICETWHEIHSGDLTFGEWLARGWDALVTFGQPAEGEEVSRPWSDVLAPLRNPSRIPAILALLLIVPAVMQIGLIGYASQISPEKLPVIPKLLALESDALPAQWHGLERVDFKPAVRPVDDIFGRYSKTYLYRNKSNEAPYTVSFDFPFPNAWHELTVCYTANGWKGVRREIHDGTLQRAWPYVEADFEKPTGERATLLFAEFDQYGEPMRPQRDWLDTGEGFFTTRNLYLRERHAFQVQVWIPRGGLVTAADRAKGLELLLDAEPKFREHVRSEAPNTHVKQQAVAK
jgi:exosortase